MAITNSVQDDRFKMIFLQNMGEAYYFLKQYDKAVDYTQQNLAIAQTVRDSDGQKHALNAPGSIYYQKYEYDGLSRSLISAGMPSVIVSLWAVNDNSTSFLMTEFYNNLQQKLDKSTALRKAMLTTMQKYPQPKNWAAFTLIGES